MAPGLRQSAGREIRGHYTESTFIKGATVSDPVADISPRCEYPGMTLSRLTEVDLVATGWITALDFYEALLAALGAPEWHGRSVDALVDSMIVGRVNKIDPPMVVRISKLNDAGEAARDALIEAFAWLTTEGATLTVNRTSATLEISTERA